MSGSIDKLEKDLKAKSNPEEKVDILYALAWGYRYINTGMALGYGNQALELSKNISYSKGIAYAKLYISVCNFLLSKEDNILKILLESVKYFESIPEENGYAIALNFTGNVYESYGDYQKALKYCLQALEIARKNNHKECEGDTLSTIGLIYSRLSDFQQSLEFYEQGLKIREDQKNYKAVASSMNLIARTNSLLGNYSKALEYYNKSLEIRKEHKQFGAIPWTYLGIASTYEKTGDTNAALKYYLEGIELNKEHGDKRCNLHCFLGIGRIYTKTGDISNGLEYLQKALNNAQALKAKPLIYEIFFSLAECYEKDGKSSEALEYYKKYHELREEILNAETHNKLKHQQIDFAIEKTEKEKEIYHLRNVELKAAFDEIEEKNLEITDSIHYAKRIQFAVLPSEKIISKNLPEHFILFKPKDIVSGDFYWVAKKANKFIVAAADCTGHGVPGAFMSMLGITFLNEIVTNKGIISANEILNHLRNNVMNALGQTGKDDEAKDGMDIALCVIDFEKNELEYSGAYNPLYMIHNEELTEVKADRMPIGIYGEKEESFTLNKIKLEKGNTIYIFSDGYVDQFGGPEGKKFKSVSFKKLLTSIQNRSMKDQKAILEETIEDWKNFPNEHGKNYEQIDDIVVIGIRI